jgi:hypothetical protein
MLRAASLAALSLLAALVVACGGGGASGEADPAAAVPADAMFYAEATIKPEGDQRDDAEAAAGKVLRTDDPAGKIRELLDKALSEDHANLGYDKDIKPWLGDRLGLWLDTRLDKDGDPGGALILAVTDQDAAIAAVRKGSTNSGEKLTKRSYNGADYDVDEDGDAFGAVGEDFVAFGPEAQFKRTIDAEKSQGLSDADRYKTGLGKLDDERLAHFYADLRKIIELAASQEGEDQDLQQLRSLIPFDKLGPIMGSFQANADRLALDVSVSAQGGDLGALGDLYSASATPLLQELPGDSWAAFGSAKYGESLKRALDQYAGLLGGAAAREQLKNQLGIDLDEDILSWVGDVALFVRGDTVNTLDGGLVIQVTDEGKAAKGFGKLVGLVQAAGGLRAKPVKVHGAETAFAITTVDGAMPKPVIVARSAEKVVVTYGPNAATAALKPSSKLGDSDTWKGAQAALDDDDMQPTLLVAMAPILKLVDSSSSGDADYAKVKPYLEAYDVLALGSKTSDGNARVRFAAGLK